MRRLARPSVQPLARVLPHPALHASHAGIWLATREGTRAIGRAEAIRTAAETPVILLNAPLIGQRLGYAELSGLDLLELFAFIRPARFCAPSPSGLALAMGQSEPKGARRRPRRWGPSRSPPTWPRSGPPLRATTSPR